MDRFGHNRGSPSLYLIDTCDLQQMNIAPTLDALLARADMLLDRFNVTHALLFQPGRNVLMFFPVREPSRSLTRMVRDSVEAAWHPACAQPNFQHMPHLQLFPSSVSPDCDYPSRALRQAYEKAGLAYVYAIPLGGRCPVLTLEIGRQRQMSPGELQNVRKMFAVLAKRLQPDHLLEFI